MDGVNCLFLLSRLLDKDVRHDHLRQLLAPARERTSFWCLVDVARRVGLHAQLVKCRPEDLREVELPAIAFMENERGAGGKYVLLFGSPAQTADDVYRVVEGGTLFMRDCTIDDFRRHWSGYLLVPNKQHAPAHRPPRMDCADRFAGLETDSEVVSHPITPADVTKPSMRSRTHSFTVLSS